MKDVLVYNSLGEQLIRLAQWDRDVYISIKDNGITTNYPVHFFNKNSDRSYVVESTYSDGKLKVKIPNRLLREPYTICGYIQRNDGDSERRSDLRFIVGVVPKPQPSDYITSSDPDYIEIETLIAECEELKEILKNIDTALDKKVDKVDGKGLSSNDFTDDLKKKVEEVLDVATEEEILEMLDDVYP